MRAPNTLNMTIYMIEIKFIIFLLIKLNTTLDFRIMLTKFPFCVIINPSISEKIYNTNINKMLIKI